MSRSRPWWTTLAAVGLLAFGDPILIDDPAGHLGRLIAVRDSSFAVPDSVRALLTRVTALVADTDSSLYLADPSLGVVLSLAPSGDFKGVIGRRGAGPGEFNTVLLVGLHRDSLWAVDPGMVRLTLLPLRGGGALTIPLGMSAPTLANRIRPQVRRGLPAAVLSDGNLLVEEGTRDTDANGEAGQWSRRLLLRTTRNLEVLDTVARHPLTHSHMVFTYRDGEAHYVQPFSDDPMYGVSSDGTLLVTVERKVPGKGAAGTIVLTAWRDAREQMFRREIEYTGQRLPGSVVDSAVGFLVDPRLKAGQPTPITADSIRRLLFRPQYYPPVQAIRVARDGEIWLKVRFSESPKDASDWLVLSRRGFPLYRVSLPESFQLLEVNRRTVWGLEGDVLDVPLLVRYTIPDPAA